MWEKEGRRGGIFSSFRCLVHSIISVLTLASEEEEEEEEEETERSAWKGIAPCSTQLPTRQWTGLLAFPRKIIHRTSIKVKVVKEYV